MPILELNSIKKKFGATIALDEVDLSLNKGEIHALIGENGAGKSTLMNVLSGVFRADSGSMELKGKPYFPLNTLDARKNGIALIHQELSLAPHLSVTENILMGLESSRFGWLDRKSLNQQALEVLKNFQHSDIHPETIVGNLPIAAQQVVEICRAIAARAEIILMDEPTSSLQRNDVQHLFTLIRKLSNDGISIIYISHFLEEIREIADSFTVLRDGKSIVTGNLDEVTDDFLISKMVGRSVENLFPHRTNKKIGDTILEVKNLSVPPILKSANFELKRGEILGIAGLMGSGRSEMVRAIYGLNKADSGKILVSGTAVSAHGGTPAKRLLQGLGYLSEDRKGEGLALTLSIADNLTVTRFSSCAQFGWLNLSDQKLQSEALIKEIGIRTPTVTNSVSRLSGGNQQKVAIGRIIHQNADILLLDEPTRGIDIGSKVQVYEMIAKLAEEGKAILMISSYLPELFGMCDRLAVMSRGQLSEALPITDWTAEKIMQTAIGK
ncbi:MAG: sugar ABC transporter ATP-binding protein [Pyrinomonadaceae bacterium]|nr:sugar ABC transporter ATP-binding protein [Pyrinomonadaceae bacterium]